MRIIVVGYDKMLAALISGAKLKGHDIIGALRIDRVKYSNFALFFKDIFNPSSDFSFLKSHKIYDIKTNSVKCKKFEDEIKRLKPDIILVGSWSEKFPKNILNLPKHGIINCHPSLLPKHRGANPYFWAIYSGEEKTGVTFHRMNENFDTGDILMQAAFRVEPYMTGGMLKNKATKVAELMVGELLDDIEKNTIIPVHQDETKATYDKYPYDGIDFVDFLEDAVKIYNKIRGLRPWAYCSCVLEDRVYRIKSAKLLNNTDILALNADISEFCPGEIIKADMSQGKKIFIVKCAFDTVCGIDTRAEKSICTDDISYSVIEIKVF